MTTVPIDFNVLSTDAVQDTRQLTTAVQRLGLETKDTRGELTTTGREAQTTAGRFNQLRTGVGALRTAFITLGLVAVARGVVRLTDRFTELQNRIRPLVSDTQELTSVYEALDDIALSTQTTTEQTVELFARLRIATRDLGLGLEDAAALTETLSNLQRITVSSTQEASNALRQFSQGLASGALRGEELNSILENLPDLARIIASELGVTIGQLRELGAEGAISSEVLVRALAGAREEIAELADNQIPTTAQGFSILLDQATDLASRFFAATAEGSSLGEVLIDIAEAIDSLDDIATTVGIRIGAAFSLIGNSIEFAFNSLAVFKDLFTALFTDRTLQDVAEEYAEIFSRIDDEIDQAVAGLFASNEELLEGARQAGLDTGTAFVEGVKVTIANAVLPPLPVRRPDQDIFQDQFGTILDEIDELRREQDENELTRIAQTERQKLSIVQAALFEGLISEEEAARRSLIITQQATAQRLGLLRGFTEQLATQFEEVEGLGKAFFIANKAVAIAEATINTAQAVTKALSSQPFPQNIAAAALTAAAGAVQIATITATAIQGLQEGGEVRGFQGGGFVPGAGPGDRVPALLEPGEIVINRRASSRFRDQLLALNNQVPRFQGGGQVGRPAAVTAVAAAPVFNIDARGADIGTVQRIEAVLVRQQEQINRTDERIRADRRNDPRFFSQ